MNGPGTGDILINDLNLGAYLVTLGYPVVGIVPRGSARRDFVFRDVPQEVILAYYSDQQLVAPRKLLDAVRNMKALATQHL